MTNLKEDSKIMDLHEKEKLEWIQTFEEIQEERKKESSGLRQKMITKIKSNPVVPVGLLATTLALSAGLYAMKTGNKKRSQQMMRARVLAQGFTVAALLGGIVIAANTKPPPKT